MTINLPHRIKKQVRRLLTSRVNVDRKLYERATRDRNDKIRIFPAYNHHVKPVITIVVPAFNTPERYLRPLIESIAFQTYDNWELILVDASDHPAASSLINKLTNKDTRISVVKAKNKGISKNTNVGIEYSKGDFIAFMDHDDTLELDALDVMVAAINKHPEAGLFYSDEDKLSEDGTKYLNPHFKPDWSPHLFSHVNYITHFVVVKKSIVDHIGGLDPNKDGAQDYDFVLRVSETNTQIVHVPKVLYHWRIAEKSTAQDISNKPYVLKAGVEALQSHYDRLHIKVKVMAIANMPGFYDVIHQVKKAPTIIFTPTASAKTLEMYIEKMREFGYLNGLDIICPKGVRVNEKIKALFIDREDEQNFIIEAIKIAGDNLIVVSDFVFPTSDDWAMRLSGILEDQRVHVAAPIILETDGTIYDSGIIDTGIERIDVFKNFKYAQYTYFGNTDWPRNVDELTGRVLAARKKDLEAYFNRKSLNNSASSLQNFSVIHADTKDKYNVLWSNVKMVHAKVSLANSVPGYFNGNIYKYNDSFHLLADEQEVVDAILSKSK